MDVCRGRWHSGGDQGLRDDVDYDTSQNSTALAANHQQSICKLNYLSHITAAWQPDCEWQQQPLPQLLMQTFVRRAPLHDAKPGCPRPGHARQKRSLPGPGWERRPGSADASSDKTLRRAWQGALPLARGVRVIEEPRARNLGECLSKISNFLVLRILFPVFNSRGWMERLSCGDNSIGRPGWLSGLLKTIESVVGIGPQGIQDLWFWIELPGLSCWLFRTYRVWIAWRPGLMYPFVTGYLEYLGNIRLNIRWLPG